MGSGSTGVACVREGFSFVGIDIGEENVETSRKRIGSAIPKSIQLDLMGGDSMFEREVEEIKELDRLFVIARQSRQERDWKAYDDAEEAFNARSRVDMQTLHRDDPGDPRSTSCHRH